MNAIILYFYCLFTLCFKANYAIFIDVVKWESPLTFISLKAIVKWLLSFVRVTSTFTYLPPEVISPH